MDTFELLMWAMFAAAIVGTFVFGGMTLVDLFKSRRTRRVARIEADLDRTQAELRQTILRLAEELGADAHEARKALIRESFLATGSMPDSAAK